MINPWVCKIQLSGRFGRVFINELGFVSQECGVLGREMLHSLVHSFFKNVRLLLGLLGKGRCMERLGCGLGVGAISVQSNDLDP